MPANAPDQPNPPTYAEARRMTRQRTSVEAANRDMPDNLDPAPILISFFLANRHTILFTLQLLTFFLCLSILCMVSVPDTAANGVLGEEDATDLKDDVVKLVKDTARKAFRKMAKDDSDFFTRFVQGVAYNITNHLAISPPPPPPPPPPTGGSVRGLEYDPSEQPQTT